ncbi:unnamed protein product [Polarella glacialis]|uniref:Uncharacterized protein n=1 Tax=Polarella glacialis TaxID=89957 RepID=A0A813GBD7_POLGL|nr:unnamed protein product [Polarella glacialis]CAE8715676.1 unnamed protein product [Polarella glacialis]
MQARPQNSDSYGMRAKLQSDHGCDDYFNPWTPLTTACKLKKNKMVELLLTSKADANAGSADDCFPSALLTVCNSGCASQEPYDRHLIAMLLEFRAEVNGRPHGVSAETPFRSALFHACRDYEPDVVEMLLTRQADVNTPDEYGDAPLHMAAGAGCSRAVAALLDSRADVNALDADGHTPRECQLNFQLMKKATVRDFHMLPRLLGKKTASDDDEEDEENERDSVNEEDEDEGDSANELEDEDDEEIARIRGE